MNGSHSTHYQQDNEVQIYYRFHPHFGAVVPLQRRTAYRGEEVATVAFPDGTIRRIPTWMIEPQAAQLDIHEPPRFSLECLADLRRVLDVALRVLDDAATVSAHCDESAT